MQAVLARPEGLKERARKPNRKVEQGASTRSTLIATARRLFAAGFDKVGTPAIATAAKVTRGALYHHFADKRELFHAVVDHVAADVVVRVDRAAMASADDPVEAVVAGCHAFVAACDDDATRQIFLVDAPAVLGWRTWREIDAAHGLGSLKAGLGACADVHLLDAAEIDAVAHLISGALNEAVFVIAGEPRNGRLRTRINTSIETMVRAFFAAAR